MSYCLGSRLLVTLLENSFYLSMKIRVLSFQLHQRRSPCSRSLSDSNIKDLLGHLLGLLEELLHASTSAVLQTGRHRGHSGTGRCRSSHRRTSRSGVLRHVLLLNHLHIELCGAYAN